MEHLMARLSRRKGLELVPMEIIDAPIIHDLFQLALDSCVRGGWYMEFGVANGASLREIRKRLVPSTIPLYGFDSFRGLSEPWRNFARGTFATTYRVQLHNTHLIEGDFNDSLPPFLNRHSGFVSFIHIDCDLFRPTKTIFDYLGNHLASGSVIVFDELFGYEGFEHHEYKAWSELVEETAIPHEWIGRWDAFRAAVRIK